MGKLLDQRHSHIRAIYSRHPAKTLSLGYRGMLLAAFVLAELFVSREGVMMGKVIMKILHHHSQIGGCDVFVTSRRLEGLEMKVGPSKRRFFT